MGESGCVYLPTSSHCEQSGGEVAGLPMQDYHSDCSRVAQHALVLGSSGHIQPNPTESAKSANLLTQPFNQIPHSKLTNLDPHTWLLEPQLLRNRASLKQWQHELRLLKEDQPDQSMRQVRHF